MTHNSDIEDRSPFLIIQQSLIIVVCIILCVAAFWWLTATAPQKKRTERTIPVPLVDTMAPEVKTMVLEMNAMASVIPAQESTIQSEVSGRIIWAAPELRLGARIAAGTVLYKLDDRDYRIALQKAEATLQSRQSELIIEEANVTLAQEELALFDQPIDEASQALILREPQLASSRASVLSAEADREQAALNVERCTIIAPFDCFIMSQPLMVGANLSANTTLAEIIPSTVVHLELQLSQQQYQWLEIFAATCSFHVGDQKAQLLGTLPGIERNGKLIRVLLSLEQSEDNPQLIDDFITVAIKLGTSPDKLRIPRQALRDDSHIWLYENGLLQLLPVSVYWQGNDFVLLNDTLDSRKNIITSKLHNPIAGMKISLGEAEDE